MLAAAKRKSRAAGTRRTAFLRLVLALSLAAAAWGCGLEYYPELLNPPAGAVTGGDYFQFGATPANGVATAEYPDEQYFRGFELYYKIYDPDQPTPSLITADQESIAVFEDLQSRGFRRIQRASDRTLAVDKPLVYVHPDDRGELFAVKVSFQTTDDPYPLIEVSEIAPSTLVHETGMEVQDLRRAVHYTSLPDDPTEFKRFDDFVEAGDPDGDDDIDYDPDIWTAINSVQPVTLVLYGLSYGFIEDQFREFYSQPLRLGEIAITLPPDQ